MPSSTILIPLPSRDFDPSEAAIPWRMLIQAGCRVVFATPDAQPATGDPRILSGEGLGIWKGLLQAAPEARAAYDAMVQDKAFAHPLAYAELERLDFDALLLPGGHAPGMKPYLESALLQALVVKCFKANRPVAAICHGTLLAARSLDAETGRSVLWGRRTTSLLATQELLAWNLTRAWLGDYYRTYPITTQAEVTSLLRSPRDYVTGPPPLHRDAPGQLEAGFVCRDGNYLSARWPGDAHRLGQALLELLGEQG